MSELTIIGRVERVKLPYFGGVELRARIDTGAKTSSVWAERVEEVSGGLRVQLAGVQGAYTFKHYTRVRVASSMGHAQTRYKVKIPIIIRKRRIMATFTLADRSKQVYPMLIGRSTLMKKFVVDVSRGSPLKDLEEQRSRELQSTIEEDV